MIVAEGTIWAGMPAGPADGYAAGRDRAGW